MRKAYIQSNALFLQSGLLAEAAEIGTEIFSSSLLTSEDSNFLIESQKASVGVSYVTEKLVPHLISVLTPAQPKSEEGKGEPLPDAPLQDRFKALPILTAGKQYYSMLLVCSTLDLRSISSRMVEVRTSHCILTSVLVLFKKPYSSDITKTLQAAALLS